MLKSPFLPTRTTVCRCDQLTVVPQSAGSKKKDLAVGLLKTMEIKDDRTFCGCVCGIDGGSNAKDATTDQDGENPDFSVVEIRLNEDEEFLFNLLRDAAMDYCAKWSSKDASMKPKHTDNTSNTNSTNCTNSTNNGRQNKVLSLVVRVAGGWVRDKILNVPNSDIDIAVSSVVSSESCSDIRNDCCTIEVGSSQKMDLDGQERNTNHDDIPKNNHNILDKMHHVDNNFQANDTFITGVQMANIVQDYIRNSNSQLPSTKISRIGIIAANPDQSKHLETATMRINGFELDFCNLRANEVYSSNSRIPAVTVGTPTEDSHRRDFTFNALYYNLMTQQVEDFTCRGYSDLMKRLLVTPLNPSVTFLDDPLRILRAIKFAVRYDCAVDASIVRAATQPDVQVALRTKVSRERIGKELEGMLSGKNCKPIAALRTIAHPFQLSEAVFALPISLSRANSLHAVSSTSKDPDIVSVAPSLSANGTCIKCESIRGTLCGFPYYYNKSKKNDNCNLSNLLQLHQLAWNESLALLQLLQPVMSAFQNECLQLQKQQTQLLQTSIDYRLLPLAVFISPFRYLVYTETSTANQTTSAPASLPMEYPVTQYIVKDSIKFTNKDTTAIQTYMGIADKMVAVLKECQKKEEHLSSSGCTFTTSSSTARTFEITPNRLEVGLLVREAKELWISCMILATVLLIREKTHQQLEPNLDRSYGNHTNSTNNSYDVTRKNNNENIKNDFLVITTNDDYDFENYSDGDSTQMKLLLNCALNVFRAMIDPLELDSSWKRRPLLDGKDIIHALNLKKGGPLVGHYMNLQIQYMLMHPYSTKQKCQEFLQQQYKQQLQQQQEYLPLGAPSSSSIDAKQNDPSASSSVLTSVKNNPSSNINQDNNGVDEQSKRIKLFSNTHK